MNQTIFSTITSIRILIPLILVLAAIAIFLKKLQAPSTKQKPQNQQQTQPIQQTNQNQLTQQTQLTQPTIPTTLIVLILLAIYATIYIQLTLVREPYPDPKINLVPFWSYRASVKTNPFQISDPELARQILKNILLMIPAGLLLPLLYNSTKHPVLLTILTAAALSVITEAVQYYAHLGLCETDDVMHNTLGCLIGIAILFIGDRLNPRRRMSH